MKASVTESLGYYEFKEHRTCLDDECSKLLDQRKQAKLQWLQNPSQTNGDNMNNVRRETNRNLRKKRENPKEKIDELKTDRIKMSDI
jgi:hypothetical protein